MRHEIDVLMRRVPRFGRGWRVFPIAWFPEGSVVHFEAPDAINVLPDQSDVLRLPAGSYTLRIGIWPTCSLTHGDQTLTDLKCRYTQLAPGATFEANLDQYDQLSTKWSETRQKTWLVTTGNIVRAWIPSTRYQMSLEDNTRRPRMPRSAPSLRERIKSFNV